MTKGSTVFIDGGAGGVGAVAVQIALARGATVIASAGAGNQDYLREIGATPVLYGDGMVDRVRAIAPDGVDAVFDTAGKTALADLISLVPEPSQVVTIANFDARRLGCPADDRSFPAGERGAGRDCRLCWSRTSW